MLTRSRRRLTLFTQALGTVLLVGACAAPAPPPAARLDWSTCSRAWCWLF